MHHECWPSSFWTACVSAEHITHRGNRCSFSVFALHSCLSADALRQVVYPGPPTCPLWHQGEEERTCVNLLSLKACWERSSCRGKCLHHWKIQLGLFTLAYPAEIHWWGGRKAPLWASSFPFSLTVFDYVSGFPNKIICFAVTSACPASPFPPSQAQWLSGQTRISKSDGNTTSLQIKHSLSCLFSLLAAMTLSPDTLLTMCQRPLLMSRLQNIFFSFFSKGAEKCLCAGHSPTAASSSVIFHIWAAYDFLAFWNRGHLCAGPAWTLSLEQTIFYSCRSNEQLYTSELFSFS